MAFGDSFSSSFEKSSAVAGSGAVDLLKEKIKANAEARKSAEIFDVIGTKVAEDAIKSGKTLEEAAVLQEKIMKASKLGFTVSEASSFAKVLAPETFSSKTSRNKGAFLVQIDPKTNKPYMSDAVTGERITDPSVIKGNASIFKETLTPEQVGARSLASREATTENPELDQMTQGAIAALEFSGPRLDSAVSILEKMGKDQFESLATQIQIGANNEFLVPNGSPLEDLVAELNDVKITGFGIAGSAYTGNEREVIEGGLNPIGKGFKRFKRDLMRNKDFFSARAKAGTMGLKEARKKSGDSNVYSAGNSDGKITREMALAELQRRKKK